MGTECNIGIGLEGEGLTVERKGVEGFFDGSAACAWSHCGG